MTLAENKISMYRASILVFKKTNTAQWCHKTQVYRKLISGVILSTLAFSGDRWKSAATIGPALRKTHSYGNRSSVAVSTDGDSDTRNPRLPPFT